MRRRTFISMLVGLGAAAAVLPLPDNTFAAIRRRENQHLNFGPCHKCGAKTWEQHDSGCPHASVLYTREGRVAVLKHCGKVTHQVCRDQDEAIEWLHQRYQTGDEIEIHWESGPLEFQKRKGWLWTAAHLSR